MLCYIVLCYISLIYIIVYIYIYIYMYICIYIYIILHYIILYYTILYYIILYYITLYYIMRAQASMSPHANHVLQKVIERIQRTSKHVTQHEYNTYVVFLFIILFFLFLFFSFSFLKSYSSFCFLFRIWLLFPLNKPIVKHATKKVIELMPPDRLSFVLQEMKGPQGGHAERSYCIITCYILTWL